MSYVYSKPNLILLLKDQVLSLQRDRLAEKDPWKKYELNSKTEKIIKEIKKLEEEVAKENEFLEKLPSAPKHIIKIKSNVVSDDDFDFDDEEMQKILEKTKNKFRHKSRKAYRKTKKSARKSRKASRKTKKSARKSRKASRKTKKSARK